MSAANPWRAHRLRVAARRAAPWVIYPCALIGFLNACSAACENPPNPVDVNEYKELSNYGKSAMTAFLLSTSADPSPAQGYFDITANQTPGADQQQPGLPPVPADFVSIDPGPVRPRGPGRYDLEVQEILASGETQTWLLHILVTGGGGQQRYSTVGLPAHIPGVNHAKPAGLKTPKQIPNDNPAAAAASEFLTAWLTGQGDVERYAGPNTIPKWQTPPYTAVTVMSITTAAAVPAKPAGHLDVTATVLTQARYSIAQTYTLELRAENGKWVVDSIDAFPPAGPPQ